jgi:hypothetical protein
LLVGSVHHPHINRIHERPVWCRDRGHWSDPWRIRIRDGNRIEAVSNPMPRLIVTREAHGAFWIATREDDSSRSYGAPVRRPPSMPHAKHMASSLRLTASSSVPEIVSFMSGKATATNTEPATVPRAAQHRLAAEGFLRMIDPVSHDPTRAFDQWASHVKALAERTRIDRRDSVAHDSVRGSVPVMSATRFILPCRVHRWAAKAPAAFTILPQSVIIQG